MLIFGTNIGLKLFKIKVATILNIDMNFFLLDDILVSFSLTRKIEFSSYVYKFILILF